VKNNKDLSSIEKYSVAINNSNRDNKNNKDNHDDDENDNDGDESLLQVNSNKLGLYKPSNVIRRFWSCNSKKHRHKQNKSEVAAVQRQQRQRISAATAATTIASRRRKLIFIHVFKTAGSSFRSFFYQYAKICQRKSVTLICTDLRSKYLQPNHNRNSNISHPSQLDYWKTGNGKDCQLKHYIDGTTEHATTTTASDSNVNLSFTVGGYSRINYDVIQKVDLDILNGHMPFGLHEHWNVNVNADVDAEDQYFSSTKKKRIRRKHPTTVTVPIVNTTKTVTTTAALAVPVEPLYITFFRNPIDKYVSGRLFVDKAKRWTFDEAILAIQQYIMDTDYYEGYSKYLLTPHQKENIKKANKINK